MILGLYFKQEETRELMLLPKSKFRYMIEQLPLLVLEVVDYTINLENRLAL